MSSFQNEIVESAATPDLGVTGMALPLAQCIAGVVSLALKGSLVPYPT
jgi:hypothetical protein